MVSAKKRERQAASRRFETRIRTDKYLCVHRRWAVSMSMHYIVQTFYHRLGKKGHSTGQSRRHFGMNSVAALISTQMRKGPQYEALFKEGRLERSRIGRVKRFT